MKFIIVGAGLFGSMTAKGLRNDGHEVIVVDDNQRHSCSAAAGCLIKPSWLGGLSAQKRIQGLAFINHHYQMRPIEFTAGLWAKHVIWHLPPTDVLWHGVLVDRVLAVEEGAVTTAQNGVLRGIVIVAAGVGCKTLLPGIALRGLAGVSLLFDGEVDARIRVYAPYKQAVCFSYQGKTWFGDGTAIKEENWSSVRVQATIDRAEKYFGLHNPVGIRYGSRPYVDSADGLLLQMSPGLWVNTGGAKSGAVLAGAHAEFIANTYRDEVLR